MAVDGRQFAGQRVAPPPGRTTMLLQEAGELASFSGRAVAALRGTPRYIAEVTRQVSLLVTGSTPATP